MYKSLKKKKIIKKFILTKKTTPLILTPKNTVERKKMFMTEQNKKKLNQHSQKNYPTLTHNSNNFYITNSSMSKLKTQINTINDSQNNYKTIKTSNYNNSSSKSKYFPKKNTNFINFVDRNKIRNIGLISLKLFDDYIDEKSLSFRKNTKKSTDKKKENNLYKDFKRNSIKANFLSSNTNAINVENNLKKKLNNIENNHYFQMNNYNNNFLEKTRTILQNVRKKLSLHQLMELNPYHYVSNVVKYSNSIEMKKISEKLGNIHGANFNIKTTSQRHFFKGQSYKNNKLKNHQNNNRVINSFQVTFNTNVSHRSGLVWRILIKFKHKKNNIIPSFRHACKFKAYSELWKYHSMIIEKLLVNYSEFKWFFEKEKFITEEVFNEFLECKKIEEEMKGEISFANKVFLAFDELGIGEINIKTFFLIMEITSRSNNNLEKINFISMLVENYEYRHEEKSVNILDMYELFKCLIIYENSQKDLKYLYESIKEDLNNGEKLEENIYVKKIDICNFLLNNKFIHKLIQTFKLQYKYANVNYIEEINSCFNSTVRNVKKFLNEQNEVMCDSENNYNKFEQVLQSIQNKEAKKEKTKYIEDEFENDNNEESYNDEI